MKNNSILACAVFAIPSVAMAQLVPDRLYYGVGREMPMTIKVPADKKGEIKIKLLEPVSAKELASASAAAGSVNLSTLFSGFFTGDSPRFAYAQLVVGEEKVGPAVVLQPMLNAPRAAVKTRKQGDVTVTAPETDANGKVIFQSLGGPTFTGIRAYVDQQVLMETTLGNIQFELRPDVAPNTVWSYRELVGGGYYTGVIFHRIVNQPNFPFVIQGGDPTGSGMGGPGYNIDLEKSAMPHDFGVLSMARSGDPDSGGSQFFVCLSREATSQLDGAYTTFGAAVSGAETIMAIASTPVNRERPINPPAIKSAKLVDAPPYGTGPKPVGKPGAAGTPAKAPEKPADAPVGGAKEPEKK